SGSVQNRRPNEQTYSVSAGGNHLLGRALFDYNLSLSHARQNVVDARQADFDGASAAFNVDGTDGFFPQLTPLGGVDQLDATKYPITAYRITNQKTADRDAALAANFTFPYHPGSRNGELKIGAKYRDDHKTADFNNQRFNATGRPSFAVSQGLESFTVPNYYFGRYPQGPNLSLDAATSFFNSNPGAFRENVVTEALTNKPNNYDVKEKISAFYVKNGLQLGALRTEVGVRVEHTNAVYDGFEVNRDTLVVSPSDGTSSYTDVLPSVALIYAV